MEIRLDSLKAYIDEKVKEAAESIKKDFINTMRTDIMNLQTYKLFEGETDVYAKRDDVLRIFDKYTEGDEGNADSD